MANHDQTDTDLMNDSDFEPTAWIESLAAILAGFLADPHLRYAHGVQPSVIDGELCLLVAAWLESTDRVSFDYVMEFAKTNNLETRLDRRSGERAMQKV